MMFRMFCPSSTARTITDIDLDDLQARSIDSLLLDLDNTIVAWQRFDVSEDVERWVRDALGRGMKLCIVSNTRNPRRLEEIAGRLGMPCLSRALKPHRKGFHAAMKMIGAQTNQTAVIGDQLLTDIFGGNRTGLYTILVTPIHKREFIGTKISRMLEYVLLRWLQRRGFMGTKPTSSQSEREERA